MQLNLLLLLDSSWLCLINTGRSLSVLTPARLAGLEISSTPRRYFGHQSVSFNTSGLPLFVLGGTSSAELCDRDLVDSTLSGAIIALDWGSVPCSIEYVYLTLELDGVKAALAMTESGTPGT